VIERYAPIANGNDFNSFHAGQEFCGFAKIVIGGPKMECPVPEEREDRLEDRNGGAKPSTLGANLPTTCGSEPCRNPTLARRLAVRYRCLIAAHREALISLATTALLV
jgi:hypothetical protein